MIHMANQIALYFSGYSHEEAVAGVADHLKKFWERRMMDQLLKHYASGGAGLHELVKEALQTMTVAKGSVQTKA
jgi:formate dehydrogenase subunit delta